MSLLKVTLRFFNRHFMRLSWVALTALLLSLFYVSWALMLLAGETELAKPDIWFYYFITTATTVGYGDFSPVTPMGRWVASLLVMPGAVVVFAGFLGKLSSFFIGLWRRKMQGRGDYSEVQNHIVIIGWHPDQTPKMINLIFGDARRENRKVVLCATDEMDNPFPDQIHFVRGDSHNDENMLQRAGIHHAARVIIYRSDDDKTLTSCLIASALCKKAHIVAWFEQDHMVKLMKAHCPEVECHSSNSMEMLVRSAQDPGSSRVQGQLLSTLVGPTQYSVKVPDEFPGTSFNNLLLVFKSRHEAIVLGIADSETGDDLRLNPDSNEQVKAGQLVYFMSAERIRADEVCWQEMVSGETNLS